MKLRPRRLGLFLAVLFLMPVSALALDEMIGRALFRRAWVPAPSSTKANDGLGPLFNARSCAACHRTLDRLPVETGADGIVASDHMVLRISDPQGSPDPVYGRQLQSASVTGVAPEGRVTRTKNGYAPGDLAYGPLAPGMRFGVLLAPSLRGLGGLDGVSDEMLARFASENARRDDGVRGRVNWVTDARGLRRAGRFGWKASQPTLAVQVQTAFALDLGLSTPEHAGPQGDCTAAQTACLAAPMGSEGGEAEISAEIVSRITSYLSSIQPPEPTAAGASGLSSFTATGCAACHRPSLPTPSGSVGAFTDLLLHDLGPDLDGGATEPGVAATEWRTAPLWGLSRTLANAAGLMHDGRARTIEEAVGLHGGEAAFSRTRFRALPEAEKRRLIAFLSSL
ncbi:di-heme oxidoredictase family protein [Microvirga rosea]|uniref:di-heme oxidoredictase family protein n=1 Tax=Microvirga rosea TaxID=2715425 RepID=UPI001D0AB59F|nr:di-heme oxidoredictase family protein [Microvirga rosea]MCB8823249.1 hypothetical protein [Microvirga rosea]